MKRFRYAILVISVLFIVGVALGCGGGEDDSSPLPADPADAAEFQQMELWKLELMKADRASNNEVQGSGPSSWSTHFAPDASVIREDEGEIQGRDSIHEAFMEDIYANVLAGARWSPERAEVSRSGDLGYTVGRYVDIRVDTAGVRTPVVGMYVRIWERQPGGDWKVSLDIRTPSEEADTAPGSQPGGSSNLPIP